LGLPNGSGAREETENSADTFAQNFQKPEGESMNNLKKKAALLLVLSMILSMIPMNVFGETVTVLPNTTPGSSVSANLGGYGAGSQTNLTFSYTAASAATIANALMSVGPDNGTVRAVPLTIELYRARVDVRAWDNSDDPPTAFATVTGSNPDGTLDRTTAAWNTDHPVGVPQPALLPFGGAYAWPATAQPWTATTGGLSLRATVSNPTGGVATSAGALTVGLTSVSRSGQIQTLTTWIRTTLSNAELSALVATGTLSFSVPVRGYSNDWPNARATSYLGVVGAIERGFFVNEQITMQGVRRVSWSSPQAPRNFSSLLHVPALRLSEQGGHSISNPTNQTMVFMLTAPQFYEWTFAPGRSITTASNIHGNIRWGGPGVTHPLEILVGGASHGNTFLTTVGGDLPAGTLNNHRRLDVTRVWEDRYGNVPPANQRHRIWIEVQNFNRSATIPTPEYLEIHNLFLVPTDHAQNVGEVNIDVNVGRMNAHVWANPETGWTSASINSGAAFASDDLFFTTTNSITNNPVVAVTGDPAPSNGYVWRFGWVPGATSPNTGAPARLAGGVYGGGQYTSLHVGNRGAASLSAEVHEVLNLRTGYLGEWRGTNAGSPNYNRDNNGLAHFRGVQTGVLIIEETSPGGFVTSYGAPINFQFLDDDGNPHPGIRILGMEARAGNNRSGAWNRGTLNYLYRGAQGIAGRREALPPGAVSTGASGYKPKLDDIQRLGRSS
jgi:hypothetical protein